MTDTTNNMLATTSIEALRIACANVSDDDAKAFALETRARFDARIAYETAKNADNDTIVAKLNACAAKLTTLSVARAMIACEVTRDFINAHDRDNARRNVYALDKIASLFDAVVHARSHNAITRAVVRSLIAVAAKEKSFTHALALASASDKIAVEDASLRRCLTRHTVSASTASTQASSTICALRDVNAIRSFTNETRDNCYALTDSLIARAIIETVK